jgi:HEAT repeat protein
MLLAENGSQPIANAASHHTNASAREASILAIPEQLNPDLPSLVPALSSDLRDAAPRVRQAAAYVLGVLGPGVARFSPDLSANFASLLRDEDHPEIRRVAAEALGKIAFQDPQVLGALGAALRGRDKQVANAAADALLQIGPGAAPAVGELAAVVADRTASVDLRRKAADALLRIGPEAAAAVGSLGAVVADPTASTDLRHKAADALAKIVPAAKDAIPELLQALSGSDEEVHEGAIWALGNLGREAVPLAVKPVSDVLRTDQRVETLRVAAWALGKFGVAARGSIPYLLFLATDPRSIDDQKVRETSATAISEIARALVAAKATDALPTLRSAAADLKAARDPGVSDLAGNLDVAADQLFSIFLRQFFRKYLLLIGPVAMLVLLALVWSVLIDRNPELVLHKAQAFEERQGTRFPRPQAASWYARLLLFLCYRRRVLDAWVARQSAAASASLAGEVFEPLPVRLNSRDLAELSAADLAPVFREPSTTIVVTGPGGAGKSALVREIARWCMDERRHKRPDRVRMLPVLLGVPRDAGLPASYGEFVDAIRAHVAHLITPEPAPSCYLIERLLATRHLLLALDGFPDVDEILARRAKAQIPGKVLLLTSRTRHFSGRAGCLLQPRHVPAHQLETVIRAFLMYRGDRLFFSEEELSTASARLASMFGDRGTPIAIARLYAKQLATWQELGYKGKLPDNVPEMMLLYLSQLSSRSHLQTVDRRTLQHLVKQLAWESVRTEFRPLPIGMEAANKILSAYRSGRPDNPDSLTYLFELGLLHTAGSNQISIVPDAFTEYLAALQVIDDYGPRADLWSDLISRLGQFPTGIDGIRSFVAALWDCCLTQGPVVETPVSALESLAQLLGTSASLELDGYTRRVQARRRMVALFGATVGEFQHDGIHGFIQVRQAGDTSGDFPIKILRKDGSLAICLVDVEGHGSAAAAKAEEINAVLLQAPKWGHGTPADELIRADQLLQAAGINGVTMNFTVIDALDNRLLHANAGMPYPFLFRAGRADPEQLQATGIYIGHGYGSKAPARQVEVQVDTGDTLVLLSDGFREALNNTQKTFGTSGIIASVERAIGMSPLEIAEHVSDAVADYAGQESPGDDQTIAVIRIGDSPGTGRPPDQQATQRLSLGGEQLEFSLPNNDQTGRISDEVLKEKIKAWATPLTGSSKRVNEIWNTTWEAVQNAWRYGSRPGDTIHVALSRDATGIWVSITQPHRWTGGAKVLLEVREKINFDKQRIHLGGIIMMTKLASGLAVSNCDRTVQLHFRN